MAFYKTPIRYSNPKNRDGSPAAVPGAPGTRGSRTGRNTREKAMAESRARDAAAKAAAEEAAKAQAKAEALKVAQAKATKAQQVKNITIAKEVQKSREQRVQEQMQRQRQLGLLPTRNSAENIVDARIRSENKTQRIMTGEVTAVPKATGTVNQKIQQLENLQKRKSTSSIRNRQKNIVNELSLLGLTIGTTIIGGVQGIVSIPSTVVSIAKNPAQLKAIPASIKKSGAEFAQLIRISPTEAFGKIAGEILFLKGSGETFKVVGKVGSRAATRLSPKFRGVKKGAITIPSTTKGKTIQIKVGGSVSKIKEPLTKQAGYAGKQVTAVSAQADRVIRVIKDIKRGGGRIIRKPIPGEAGFSKTIKKLLKKFDDGTITKTELVKLESKVPVLERSFFADPKGRFRPSRLGTAAEKKASLVDILSGDVTFKSPKPQILVFENIKVAKFPKALKDVEKALKAGKTLTSSQGKRLLNWQIKKTGKFKPIGALSKEPEITLAPGEIIKKVKKVGNTLINGKKVEIIQAKVVKSTGRTTSLLKKSKKGAISSTELKELTKRLAKETGFKTSLSRSSVGKARVRLPVSGVRLSKKTKTTGTNSRFVKGSKEAKRYMKSIRQSSKRTTTAKRTTAKRTTAKRKTTRRKVTKRKATKRTTARRTLARRTGKRTTPKKPVPQVRIKENFKSRTLQKKVQTYYVVEKVRGKFKKLYPKPLTAKDAKDYAVYSIDNRLSKTAFFIPLGKAKKVLSPPKKIQGYYSKNNRKVRPYKIRYGKKKQMVNGFIEKRKYFQDTKGEVAQAKRLRSKKRTVKRKITRPVKRKPMQKKRRYTAAQKKVMLRNLKKARAARKRR